tara:strand:+ start:521 stop:1390 length:870 start_codon:yes stop_codon:yes gene_type:complete
MATVDLGKIKLKWRGTYAGGTAYTPDDVVYYVDGTVGSSYICIANTTGNAPSSGGSLHASWNYLAKGQAVSPTTTQGDIIVRGASADQRLAIGAAGKALKVNASANGLEYGEAGGLVKLESASLTGQTLSNISIDHFSTTYKAYYFVWSNMTFSANTYPRMRLKRNDNNSIETGSQYEWHAHHPYNQSGGYGSNNHGSWTQTRWDLNSTNPVHSNWSFSGNMTFYDPMSSIRKTSATWMTESYEGDRTQHNLWFGAGTYLQMNQIKGFYWYPASGVITGIDYTLFGIIN